MLYVTIRRYMSVRWWDNAPEPKEYVSGVFEAREEAVKYVANLREGLREGHRIEEVEVDFPLYVIQDMNVPDAFPEGVDVDPDMEDVTDYSTFDGWFFASREGAEALLGVGDTLFVFGEPWTPGGELDGADQMGRLWHDHVGLDFDPGSYWAHHDDEMTQQGAIEAIDALLEEEEAIIDETLWAGFIAQQHMWPQFLSYLREHFRG